LNGLFSTYIILDNAKILFSNKYKVIGEALRVVMK